MAKGVCCLMAAPGVGTCKGTSPLLKGSPACTHKLLDQTNCRQCISAVMNYILVLVCRMALGRGMCMITSQLLKKRAACIHSCPE